MKKLLALGTAGALAALIGVGSAQAQGFGISVGYGSPGFDDFDAGFGWGAGYRPYSWGGPRYVGSYYAPIAGGYAYDEPATVVTTRRVAAVPAYDYYAEPRAVVSTRRVVRRTLVAAPAAPMRRVVAARPTTITMRRAQSSPRAAWWRGRLPIARSQPPVGSSRPRPTTITRRHARSSARAAW